MGEKRGFQKKKNMVDTNLPSAEVMKEQAYLVGRGVRLLAIVDSVENVIETIVDVRQMLNEVAVESAGSQERVPIPFLIKDPHTNWVRIGFAAYVWVIDIYEWLLDGTVPEKMACRVEGLLLGYSGAAIAQYEYMQAGQRVSTRQEGSSNPANHVID